MPERYYLAVFLLILAGVLLMINVRTPYNKAFAKFFTYYSMWAAIIASVVVVTGAVLR